MTVMTTLVLQKDDIFQRSGWHRSPHAARISIMRKQRHFKWFKRASGLYNADMCPQNTDWHDQNDWQLDCYISRLHSTETDFAASGTFENINLYTAIIDTLYACAEYNAVQPRMQIFQTFSTNRARTYVFVQASLKASLLFKPKWQKPNHNTHIQMYICRPITANFWFYTVLKFWKLIVLRWHILCADL